MAMGAAEAVGWIGTGLTALWFLSPAPTFRGIVRCKSVGTYDAMPYLMTLLQCILWLSYSMITPDRSLVFITNVLGASLELLWCLLYLRYSDQKRHMATKLLLVAILWLGATLLIQSPMESMVRMKPLKHGETTRTEFMGMLCVIANIISYAAPLGVFRQVVRTRSVDSMPLGLSVAATCSSSCWCVYAFLKSDVWVLIPNINGVFLGFVQLGLYTYYCRGPSNVDPCEGETSARGLQGASRLIP
mmetsp:Transcript_12774/g.36661  ORF Transcript_12774/g.36661 Transcript_12774/m.36661 type:complete len:245 (+) Transcript_12774:113-847(+)